jgi:NADH dehydrogenase FAD-containing subunit
MFTYHNLCEQVAKREGKYLVELFNKIGKQNGGKVSSANDIPLGDPFVYKHLGSMASVGGYKALVDLRQSKVIKGFLNDAYFALHKTLRQIAFPGVFNENIHGSNLPLPHLKCIKKKT